jgi:hypothetical protein
MSITVANPLTRVPNPSSIPARLRGYFRLCRNCRVALRDQVTIENDAGAQMWACAECGTARQWGFFRPWDRFAVALLHCARCEGARPHGFVGVI